MDGREQLAAVIDRTSAALALVGEAERAPWSFTRCVLAAMRFENLGRDPADLELALADFDALPPDFPGRTRLAATLMTAQLRASIPGRPALVDDPARFARAAALAEIANQDPDPLPHWPKVYASVRAQALVFAAHGGAPGFSPRAALTEIEQHARTVAGEQPYAKMVETSRLALEYVAAAADNDLNALQRTVERTSAFGGAQWSGSAEREQFELIARLGRILPALLRGDVAAVREVLEEVGAIIAKLPPDDPTRVQFDTMQQMAAPLLGSILDGGPGGPVQPGGAYADVDPRPSAMTAEQIHDLGAMTALPGQSDTARALHLSVLASAQTSSGTRESLDQAIELYQQAVEISPPHDPWRAYHLMCSGITRLRRMELTGRRDDLAEGTALLEQARAAAGSSNHAIWARCSIPLAQAYHVAGRHDLAHEVALSGLHGHAWSVLLQSGAADAHAVARHAAGDAREVAEMCLAANAPEQAAAALEMGRGLILYAATETRDAAARLVQRDEEGLAAEWHAAAASATPDEIPGELRRRVVGALTGVPLNPDGSMAATPAQGTTRLLDPPDLHEVRAALKALAMDVLIYLVPGDDGAGAAVVIAADDEPAWVRLPQLNAERLGGFQRFTRDSARGSVEDGGAGTEEEDAARDAAAVLPKAAAGTGPNGAASGSAVDQACDWAWEAAIGPLLDRHLDVPVDRPIRIVLIPVRELSRVPWHAARHRSGGQTRYALERAVISYAASARMFCESAWRGDVPLTDAGLVVGDPDTAGHARDLHAARAEARAVKDCFYPAARYIGRRADGQPGEDGTGEPEQIRRWLADPEGGSMAHLACHGVVRAGIGAGDTSYLLLAGGRHLAAEELISALSADKARGIGLAVLAACNSAESGRGYDEAFSLATTFLAHGVRSVISAQWSVPDAETSVLMFMFHYYLRDKGLAPLDALRAAQLWMIGDRTPPETMPPALRMRFSARREPDIASWAAFVHTGR